MNKQNDDILSILADGPLLDWLYPWIVIMLIAMVFSDDEPNLFMTIVLVVLAVGALMQISSICVDKVKEIRALKARRRLANQ